MPIFSNTLFSINSKNCQSKECLSFLSNCQKNCAQIYSLSIPSTEGCTNINDYKQQSISLNYVTNDIIHKIESTKNFLSQKMGSGKIIDRIWLWAKLPKTTKELWTLFEIGLYVYSLNIY